MLTQKDLECKEYKGKELFAFKYVQRDKSGNKRWEAQYSKGEQPNEWYMAVVLWRTRDADSQVYNFGYIMPKSKLPIELVAATGLKYFQLYLKQELEQKIAMDFEIGEITDGIVGWSGQVSFTEEMNKT